MGNLQSQLCEIQESLALTKPMLHDIGMQNRTRIDDHIRLAEHLVLKSQRIGWNFCKRFSHAKDLEYANDFLLKLFDNWLMFDLRVDSRELLDEALSSGIVKEQEKKRVDEEAIGLKELLVDDCDVTDLKGLLVLIQHICVKRLMKSTPYKDGWDGWVKSDWKGDENIAGAWNHTSCNRNGDANDKGIQTSEDHRFYALSAEYPEFSNKGKTLVLQFCVEHEQKLDCGGGYMKSLSGDLDQKKFGGGTPYSTYNGENKVIKKDVPCETDHLTHVYTLILRPNATYSILLDNVEKQTGSLYSDWDLLSPNQIKDPEAKKPEDWDGKEYIPDPEDKKPKGYDDIPKEIRDPDAKKNKTIDDFIHRAEHLVLKSQRINWYHLKRFSHAMKLENVSQCFSNFSTLLLLSQLAIDLGECLAEAHRRRMMDEGPSSAIVRTCKEQEKKQEEV